VEYNRHETVFGRWFMTKEEQFAFYSGILSSKLHNLFPTEGSEGVENREYGASWG